MLNEEAAYKANNDLRYVHQDHLAGTSITTDGSGGVVASVKYYPRPLQARRRGVS